MDGLRFLAVTGVIILHQFSHGNTYLSKFPFGTGVDLFFIISGFLITKILIESKLSIDEGKQPLSHVLKAFYWRRILRIFPIYYLTLAFLYLINLQNTTEVFAWLVSYTTNIWISLDKPYIGSFNHLWSLAVEEQFYLIWPFLILFTSRKSFPVLIVLTIASSVIFKFSYYLIYGWSDAINNFTLSGADSLGLGALIAYLFIFKRNVLQNINKAWYLLVISFVLFLFFDTRPFPNDLLGAVGGNTIFSIFGFFVVAKASEEKFTGIARVVLENPVSRHLGKISYGIYLYHFFMPDLYNWLSLDLHMFSPDSAFRKAFYVIAVIAISELSWYLVEKPILKYKDRFKYV